MTFYLILQIVVAIFAIFGGVYSFIQLIKNFNQKLMIRSNIGVYSFNTISLEGAGIISSLNVQTKINFLNQKNETIAITDIVGSIKYKTGKKLTEKRNNRKEDIFPIIIKSKEAQQSELMFIFENINLDYVSIYNIPTFIGFLGNDPILFQDRLENNTAKNKVFEFFLHFHINGNKIKTYRIPILENTLENRKKMRGTFTDLDLKRIEQNI